MCYDKMPIGLIISGFNNNNNKYILIKTYGFIAPKLTKAPKTAQFYAQNRMQRYMNIHDYAKLKCPMMLIMLNLSTQRH